MVHVPHVKVVLPSRAMSTSQPPESQPIAKTDGKAIGSLVCGILGITCFSIVAGIPAIVLGHSSRSSIKRSMGRLQGAGMALAGLIMGYLSIALLIPIILMVATIAIPNMLRSRQVANETFAIVHLREINTAEINFRTDTGSYGDLQSLVNAKQLDPSFLSVKAGYTFTVTVSGDDYTAFATPASPNTARYGYISSSDGLIRYSTDANLAPVGAAGDPVP
jgi:type II secretory pathway pseudopilin PulG